jgi:predicted transposase/invertase (TIGR01784 family)
MTDIFVRSRFFLVILAKLSDVFRTLLEQPARNFMKLKTEKKADKKLSPMLDVVFKMIFAGNGCEKQLISLLTAVLQPASPIHSVEVLNPSIPKNQLAEKGVVLDILVKLSDESHINVEMQAGAEKFLEERACYYLARTCAGQISVGDLYSKLRPSIVIFFLAYDYYDTESRHYHLCQMMREREDRIRPKTLMEIHTIEIPKLIRHVKSTKRPQRQKLLELWGLFLYNPEDPDLKEAIMTEPAIKKAQEQLTKISGDKEAREIARLRENGLRRYNTNIEAAREEGLAEGEAKGLAEGEAKGLAEGEAKGRYSVLRQMLANPATQKLEPEALARLTGLTVNEVNNEIAKNK